MVEPWTKAWEEEQRRINSLWDKNENMTTAVMDRALQMFVVHLCGNMNDGCWDVRAHGLKMKDGVKKPDKSKRREG